MMKWRKFGRNLLKINDNEKLTLIEQNCDTKSKEFKFKCEALLETWKASNDDPKWEQVIAALRKTSDELNGLATKLEKVLKANQQVGTSVAGVIGMRSRQNSNEGKQCLRYAVNCCTNKRRLTIF